MTSRKAITEWLRARPNRRVRLRMSGSALLVVGVCQGVEVLDACSTEISECLLSTGVPGVTVSLTFHDETLSLQILLTPPGQTAAVISVPVSIPYGLARLDELRPAPPELPGRMRASWSKTAGTAAAEQPAPQATGGTAHEAVRDPTQQAVTTPYWLLHEDTPKET